MPPRSDTPGLQRAYRTDGAVALTWVPPRKAVAAGYPPTTTRLHYPDGSDELARICQDLFAQAIAWVTGEGRDRVASVFDGTAGHLIRIYETHKYGLTYQKSLRSQETYTAWCHQLYRAVGKSRLAGLYGIDLRDWHERFKEPSFPGGPEHLTGAHCLMTMVRILFKFGHELNLPHCKRLRDVLKDMEFPKGKVRKQILTYNMVVRFIREAHKLGFHEMALAQALQYEGMFRQTDVIGKWEPEWTAGVTWEEIDADGVLTHTTSKRGREVIVDLKAYPLVKAEMELVPEYRRAGAMVIDSVTGEPFRYVDYYKRWRTIAQAAGIPDDVWNRDSRAGGVTEGGDAGADIEDLRQHAGHRDVDMTRLYDRPSVIKARRVAGLRVDLRKAQSEHENPSPGLRKAAVKELDGGNSNASKRIQTPAD